MRSSHQPHPGIRRHRRLRLLAVAAGLVALSWLDACAARGPIQLEPPVPLADAPVWPTPPAPPRIRLVRTLTSAEALGFRRSVLRRVVDFIRGRDHEDHLRHPYGMAATDSVLYVVDASAQGVHVYDLKAGRYRFFTGDGFQHPVAVTPSDDGRLYVSDSEGGAVVILDARSGDEVGRLDEGLQRPTGVAFHPDTRLLYVVDTQAHQVVVFDIDGSVATRFGGRGTEAGRFNYPTQIAVGPDGRIYIADSMNFRVQVLEPDGTPVRTMGRLGDAVGEFARPKGIGVDAEGRVFVVEGLYDVVNVFDDQGRLLITFGGAGRRPGEFWLATGLTVDTDGRIYVADSYNGRVQVFRVVPEEAGP
ncbi:MAG: SMP-30/gluconolactonase/LRE family protein [Gemmatimonadota bacterium]